MGMDKLWDDNKRGQPNDSFKNVSQCHFVLQKSHTEWLGIEHRPPRYEVSINDLNHDRVSQDYD